MKTVTMSPETLAHHLRIAATEYTKTAATMREPSEGETPAQRQSFERLAQTFDKQAEECQTFATAVENAHSLGFDSGDNFEISYIA
jgi:hypothetical protein